MLELVLQIAFKGLWGFLWDVLNAWVKLQLAENQTAYGLVSFRVLLSVRNALTSIADTSSSSVLDFPP